MTLRLRRAIEREFDCISSAYSRLSAQKSEREVREVAAWIAPRRDEWVLDAACGPARLARALAPRCQLHSAGSVLFAVGDVERLPYRSRSFHLATCAYAFANFPDPLKVLQELARVTRRDGRIAIVDLVAPEDPAQRGFLCRLETLRGHLPARILSRSEFDALFRRAGLLLESCRFARRRRRFRDWLRLSPAAIRDPRRAHRLRRMLLDSLDGHRGGLAPRRLDGDIVFHHTTGWFMLRAAP
ncbi:MAG: hypothetical protein DMG26_03570 [Acidobacteria bacterium]|nr:MAG: hypothetical protein DMG26_03570 [Acidobacteriota bacterium]